MADIAEADRAIWEYYARELAGGKPTPAGCVAIERNRAFFAHLWTILFPLVKPANAPGLFEELRRTKDAIGTLFASSTMCPDVEMMDADVIKARITNLREVRTVLANLLNALSASSIPEGASDAQISWRSYMLTVIKCLIKKCLWYMRHTMRTAD